MNYLRTFIQKLMSTSVSLWNFVLILCLLISQPAFAHDMDWGIWHGEQNALVIGTIETLNGKLGRIHVHHKLVCGPQNGQKNTIDRMLPASDIPQMLTVNLTGYDSEIFSYYISYHGKEKPEQGDIVLLSLDKKEGDWSAVYPPLELSGSDLQTVMLLPENQKTKTAAAWEIFLRSGGRINEFIFADENKVLAEMPAEDGTVKNEVLWEKQQEIFSEGTYEPSADATAAIESSKQTESPKLKEKDKTEILQADGSVNGTKAIFAVIISLCITGGLIIRLYKKKRSKGGRQNHDM